MVDGEGYPRGINGASSKTFCKFHATPILIETFRLNSSDSPVRWDVREARGNCICRETFFFPRGRLGDSVTERRPIADARFEFIPGLNRADAGRGPGNNQIARFEGQRLTRESDDLFDRVNHLASARLLPRLAILPQGNGKIVRVHLLSAQMARPACKCRMICSARIAFPLSASRDR